MQSTHEPFSQKILSNCPLTLPLSPESGGEGGGEGDFASFRFILAPTLPALPGAVDIEQNAAFPSTVVSHKVKTGDFKKSKIVPGQKLPDF